jgi:subtilisin
MRGVRLFVLLLVVSILASSVATIGAAPGPQSARVKVLIAFTRQPGPAQEALVRGIGGTIRYSYHLVPAIAATVPEQAIEGLRRNPNVTAVDLDGQVWAIDAELDNAWGVKHIGAGTVHDTGNKGSGVSVAIIDSGIDDTHPDLDANYAGGWDFVNDDPDPQDDYGHGTHVAGTVAAEDNDLAGSVVGVAPEATLYGLKVLNANGAGNWSDIIAAVEWCIDPSNPDVDVANLSLGTSLNPGATAEAAFANAEAQGLVIVAAAGNSGNPPGRGDSVIYPARWDSVIAVAATDSSDKRARWSSTGDQVELAAPGVAVYSTWPVNMTTSPHDPQPACDNDGVCYKYGSGTSMASPHVAGTAALIIGSGITDANGDGYINDEVRQRLDETADDLGVVGRDPQYGFGLVDADEAAVPPGPVNQPPIVSIDSPADGSTFDSGATIDFEGTASDSEDGDLTSSLDWVSNLGGPIGTGGSFSTPLSDGNHTITASVTDSGGATGDASISITVGTPPSEPTSVSVASITYGTVGGGDGKKHLLITVALVDDLGNTVDGASVSIQVDLDGSSYWSGSGSTEPGGTVTFRFNNAPSGSYTTEVSAVSAEGLIWDGLTPPNEFTK